MEVVPTPKVNGTATEPVPATLTSYVVEATISVSNVQTNMSLVTLLLQVHLILLNTLPLLQLPQPLPQQPFPLPPTLEHALMQAASPKLPTTAL